MATPKKETPTKENGKNLSVVKQDDAKTVEKVAFDKMQEKLAAAEKELETLKRKSKPATVADVLIKANQIKALEERLKQLDTAKVSISAFALSADGFQESLVLKGVKGNEFNTTNPEIIKAVKEMIIGRIDQKEADTKDEILALAA